MIVLLFSFFYAEVGHFNVGGEDEVVQTEQDTDGLFVGGII